VLLNDVLLLCYAGPVVAHPIKVPLSNSVECKSKRQMKDFDGTSFVVQREITSTL
jgi:hypothetical protein